MKIAACLIVRNEQPSLAEWMAYHLAIGFDALLVFDNGSTDSTRPLIDLFARSHDVRCIDWPMTTPDYQIRAYEAALGRFGAAFDWIGFIDADEFVVPLQDASIQAAMAGYADAAAVAIPWAIFGSSGHDAAPAGLAIDSFRRRGVAEFVVHRHVKTILRPGRTHGCINPHCFAVDGPYVTPQGDAVVWETPGLMAGAAVFERLQINHYFVKSQAQWRDKLRRGYHDIQRDAAAFAAYDRNEVEDTAILRFLPATLAVLQSNGALLHRLMSEG